MEVDVVRAEIAKLELREGDALAVKVQPGMQQSAIMWLKNYFEGLLPNTAIIIYPEGVSLTVLMKKVTNTVRKQRRHET
jgi:hypothetical protein